MAVALAVLALGGIVLIVIGWLGLVGKLPRNHWAGIRTFYTMRNDENWKATHRAAGPLLIFGGVAVTAAALAFLPFAITGKVSEGLAATVSTALAAVTLVTVAAAWLYGTRVARSRTGAL